LNQIVHARFNPFAEHEPAISFQVEQGRTIAEIVAAAPGVPDHFWLAGEVRINGRRVVREQWSRIRPKPSQPERPIVITLHPVFHGGGGGGSTKNIVTTVAAIALIAGATLVSGGLLAPVFGAAFLIGGIGASLTAAGLGIAATLLMSTLTPPAASKQDQDNRQLSNAGISQNPIKPMAALPVVLGRVRYSPPLIAPPYTTLENGVVYVHAVYGLAGYYSIDTDDIMLNAVPIDEVTEAEYQVRDGAPSNVPITICDKTVIEKRNSNALLTNFVVEAKSSRSNILVHQSNPDQDLPQWQLFKSAGIADEIRIRMFWPGGLQAGGTSPATAFVPIRVEIRRRGTSTWLKMPVTHFRSFRLNEQIRKEIRIKFQKRQGPAINDDADRNAYAVYYKTGSGQAFEYTAESYFQNTSPADEIPVMTAATTSGVTMSASSAFDATLYAAWKAADSSTSSLWEPLLNTLPGAWLQVQFASAKTILSYRLVSGSDADSTFPSSPNTWKVLGSNNGSTFTEIASIANFTDFASNATQWFTIDSPGSYLYYRLEFTTNNGQPDEEVFVRDLILSTTTAPGSNTSAIFANNVNIHDDGVDFFLDPAVFPKDIYEVRVKRGFAGNAGDFNKDNYAFESGFTQANFFEYVDAGSSPDRYYMQKAQSLITSETYLESFATVANDYPFHASIHQKGVAMIAVRAPSVNLESLSAIFHSIVPIWQAGVWSTDAASSNPAALARHVLLSTDQNAEALPGELLDEEAFQEFYDFCVAEGHEFNGVVDGLSVIEVFRQVLAAGYGGPDWPGYWSVIWEFDRSAETPVQLFTPLDTRGLTVTKSFPRLPHALRPIFFDASDDFNVNEASLVYMDGYDASNATRIEEMNYPGFTDAAKVAARALFDLRQMYLRPTKYSFEIGLAGLACRRGDLVMLAHDVISRYAAFGRIASIQRSGGNITGLTLEAKVDLSVAVGEIEETMAAGIQFNDRTTGTHAVNEKTVTDTITFVSPFADPGDILTEGMTVGFGPVGSETRRMLVLWYEYADELTRRITLIDEAPGLHA